MKQNNTLLQAAFVASLIFWGACKSTKISDGNVSNSKQVVKTTSKCDQTIKYYVDKVKMANDGQETIANIEIVINPSVKLISITSESPNEERVSFDTEVESIDCNFNSDMTEGQSIYKGYIKQENGTTTKAIIKLEAKDGGLTISNADPDKVGKEGEYIMLISKWEVMSQ
jgi:hypothetical protein